MTAARKKSTSSRAASKPATKSSGPSKAGSGKKRASKKKGRKSGFKGPLFAAFAAGMLMALACFWGIRQVSDRGHGGFASIPRPAESRSSAPAPSKPPAAVRPVETKAADAKNAPKPSDVKTASGQSVGTLPSDTKPAEAKPVLPPLEIKKDPPREATEPDPVASALSELANLPYEEPLAATPEEDARSVDYALMQTAWELRLPSSAMRLKVKDGGTPTDETQGRRVVEILPGKTAKPFLDVLSRNLAMWTRKAETAGAGKNEWIVFVDGTETHRIILYPGLSAFPPAKEPEAPAVPTFVPPPKSGAPRMVIVIDDLGAGAAPVDALLNLDFPVTFAFWPHGGHTKAGAKAAHSKGREVIVHLPMEPLGYPQVKPGPGVLLVGMDAERIMRRTEEGIAAVPHAAGLNNHMGSRFTQSREGTDAVLEVLRSKGMFVLDSMTHPRSVFAAEGRRLGLTTYARNVFLDVTATRAAVLAELERAERIAELTGQSIAIGHPLPETLAALKEWQKRRNKRVALVRLRDLPR